MTNDKEQFTIKLTTTICDEGHRKNISTTYNLIRDDIVAFLSIPYGGKCIYIIPRLNGGIEVKVPEEIYNNMSNGYANAEKNYSDRIQKVINIYGRGKKDDS